MGSLAIVLIFAVAGFSKDAKDVKRKVAQSGASEKVIGSVTAVERTFTLDFDACSENTKYIEPTKYFSIPQFECKVHVFPDNSEEIELSNSLDDVEDRRIEVKQGVTAFLYVKNFGFKISANWQPNQTVTKEEFLAAAQKLINKFPQASVKLLKVVH